MQHGIKFVPEKQRKTGHLVFRTFRTLSMPLTRDISITSYKISQSRAWLRCAWRFHVLGTFILLVTSAPTRFNWCAERIHETWRELLEPGNWEPLLLDCPSSNYRQSTAGRPPTNLLPLIALRSSKQLRGDGDGVDQCNSRWCKLSFYRGIIVWLAQLTFQAPCLQHTVKLKPVLQICIFMMPSSTPRRLCHILKVLFVSARPSFLSGNWVILPSCCLSPRVWQHFCACFICTSPGNVTLQRNSQLKLCVCHITENDWISEAAVKKMWSSICRGRITLSH